MRFTLFQNSPAWYRFILAVLVIIAFSILFFVLAIVIAIPIFRLTIADLQNILMAGVQTQNISFLKYLQVIQSVGTFLLPALLLAWLFTGNSYAYLQINTRIKISSIVIVIISILFAIPIINFTGNLNSQVSLPDSMGGIENKIRELEHEASELIKSFLDVPSTGGYLINLIVIAVLPAICEEFLFRGIFQRLFIEWTGNKHIGIIIAATLFSFFHLQFLGFIPRFLLGVYFGYLLVWSSSLWLPIVAHFINNAFAVTFYHFANQTPGLSWIDEIGGADGNMGYLFSSILIFAVAVVMIYKSEQSFRQKNAL
jgi:membrane protease YdiL (CAAX protease family)